MGRVPAEVVTACVYWVLRQAKDAGEDELSTREVQVRVMRMTRDQINEARALRVEAS